MGRDSSEQTVIHSSIALLQERFRQLQRVKEMREEKELFKLFLESDRRCTSPPTIKYPQKQPSSINLFFESELLLPLPPKVAEAPANPPSSEIITCLSLWPDHSQYSDNMKKKKSDCLYYESRLFKTTPLFDVVYDHDNESDVDTSLHL